jgi:phage/plasmid-associated DNA primase
MDKPAYWDTIGETAGVLNWSLAGLRSLKQAGGFVVPACVRTAAAEHQLESNPTRMFLTEHLEAAEEGDPIPSEVLYRRYQRWMCSNGHKPLAHGTFTKELRRVHGAATRATRRIGTVTQRVIEGVKWTALHEGWVEHTPGVLLPSPS